MEAMTLKQLRDKAQALLDSGVSEDTPVFSDGCDCIGEAQDLVLKGPFSENSSYILLER